MVNRNQQDSGGTPAAAAVEAAIALRFIGTGQHPCADCRDAARSGARELRDVRAGTLRRDVGGLGVRVCAECAGETL